MPLVLGKRREHAAPGPPQPLAPANEAVQRGEPLADRAALWARWVWAAPLAEPYAPDVRFNEAHLLGLLLCRDAHARGDPDGADALCAAEIPGLPRELALAPQRPLGALSSGALLQTLESLQHGWVAALYDAAAGAPAWAAAETLLRAVFRRLGYFASTAHASNEVYDDPQTTEELPSGALCYTPSTLRATLDVLVVLFRHAELRAAAAAPPARRDTRECEAEIARPHAIEATKTRFYALATHHAVPPGARLAYIHRFPGMYNNISQVAYQHNENFQRRRHNTHRDAIDMLPLIAHAHPELPVALEEERAPADAPVFWRLLSGRIYLVRPAGVLYDPDIFQLFLARNDG